MQSPSMGVLLDHTQDKIVVLDEEGDITYANAAVKRLLGRDPESFEGENAFDYIHPDDVEAARAAFDRTIAGEEFTESTVELRFRDADGSWVWFESRMANVTDEALDGYVVSSRNITDRVEAQREHRTAADRLRELSATTGDVLWMFNGDWSELLFVNPAYEEVYGQDPDAVREDPEAFLETIHPDDIPAVKDAMAALSAGESVEMEYRVNPGRDYGVWVWVQAEPIREDGEVVRISGFTRDVTDRYRRERQLYVLDNLLRHNLRNDLGVILGNAELIEEEAPAVSHRTAVIRRTGEELLASAEKERDIIELITEEPVRWTFDAVEAVTESVEAIRERFPEAEVELAAPETASVYALDEVGVAVLELVENAVVHSESDRPTVRVTVRGGEGHVTVTVADDAPPMPEIEAQVLTGDYGSDDIYHSSGLGLWLVYWVVNLSEGHVEVETTESGNEVRISLPKRCE